MRLVLCLLLASAACAKKQPPPQQPADKQVEPAGAGSAAKDDADAELRGDPCDGGETKQP